MTPKVSISSFDGISPGNTRGYRTDMGKEFGGGHSESPDFGGKADPWMGHSSPGKKGLTLDKNAKSNVRSMFSLKSMNLTVEEK